jgi:hypothetical protein
VGLRGEMGVGDWEGKRVVVYSGLGLGYGVC